MDCNFDTALFYERVIETVAWCTYWLEINDDPKELWELMPLPKQGLSWISHDERYRFAENVFEKRTELCAVLFVQAQADCLEIYLQGKLLVFFPDITTSDGVAEHLSEGFFDIDNYPPIDTWLYYVKEKEFQPHIPYLISWIPPLFVEKVRDSINVCADKSILFLAEADFEICYIDKLAELDLLV
jgi:hypothetical protein